LPLSRKKTSAASYGVGSCKVGRFFVHKRDESPPYGKLLAPFSRITMTPSTLTVEQGSRSPAVGRANSGRVTGGHPDPCTVVGQQARVRDLWRDRVSSARCGPSGCRQSLHDPLARKKKRLPRLQHRLRPLPASGGLPRLPEEGATEPDSAKSAVGERTTTAIVAGARSRGTKPWD
jgi:hypothetical protein